MLIDNLLASSSHLLLNSGVTLAILSLSGKIPVCKERSNMCNRGLRKTAEHLFNNIETYVIIIYTFIYF